MRDLEQQQVKIVAAFLTGLLPPEWESVTQYNPQLPGYDYLFHWVKLPNGKVVNPKTPGVEGDHRYIGINISNREFRELFKPPMDRLHEAYYILAHKADPPIELTMEGRETLTRLAGDLKHGASKDSPQARA